VEHVLVTQTLVQRKPKTFRVAFQGKPGPHVTAKDLVLKMIGIMGTAGGSGHVLEYTGPAIRGLTMEGRMTVCNMSIEAGARAGMIAPDETTFSYITAGSRTYAPTGETLERAMKYWQTLHSDDDAEFDRSLTIDVDKIVPQVTWGTNPGMVIDVDQPVPSPENAAGYSATDVRKRIGLHGPATW
jgi:3-isopropylmalate/(R)-2-methylmalate dehydratase large subunit